MSLLPYTVGGVGSSTWSVAVVLGVALVVAAFRLRRLPSEAMRFFGWTNLYLAGIFLSMAVDVLVRGDEA